jgi:hypothetical protein
VTSPISEEDSMIFRKICYDKDPDGPNASGVSRRALLTASAAGAAAAASGGILAQPAARAAVGMAAGNPGPAASAFTGAVLQALATHQLVGIGEQHQLQEHHDLMQTLLADPRLPDLVDDIVVEFCNSLYQDLIDRFILSDDPVDDADLRLVWRNTTQSPLQTWDAPVYEQFLRRVRAVNWTLPPDRRIRVLAGDPPIDWSVITSVQQLSPFLRQRDTCPASVVQQQVLAKGRRALIHYGGGHLLHVNAVPGLSLLPTLVSIVEQQTGVRAWTLTDLVPLAGDPGGLGTRLSRYPRDTVIPTAGTWLGQLNAGDVTGAITVHNGQQINIFCGTPLGKLQDAGLSLGQPAVLTTSWPNPAVFLDPVYWAELQRRNAFGAPSDLDSYRVQQPPPWQLASVPACSTAS